MKKLHTVFRRTSAALIAALSLLAASCSNLLDGKPPAHADPAGGAYGTLRINSGSGRALLLEEITGAEITVSGEKMSDIKAKSAASNGKGGAVIEKIPVGKNRVVTVAAERTVDNILKKMDGVVMRAATDIEPGENTVSVTWETTAVGNVFAELLKAESFDSSAVAPEAVEALVPSGVHASLVDAAKIAADIRSGTPGTPECYRLEAGSVQYTADAANGSATVQVCDPLSERQQGLAAGTGTIETVAPGTWNFYVIIDGTIFFQTEITVEGGKPTDIGEITLKTPAPRLEAKDGTALTDLLQRGAAGEKRTVYLACRTMDGEREPDGVSIYYTTDGSEPTASSAQYTAAGIEIPADKAVTIKAFAVKAGFADSETETYEFIVPQLGFTYPSDGPFSPVDENGAENGFGWNFDSEPGALISGSTATFTVYSANAERILLEIYDKNYGEDAAYDYWMEKGGDNFWRAKLNGVEAGTLYAFRAWGPNWTYSDGWTRGGSGEGFSADYDSAGNRFNPNKVLFDPYAREISHDKSNPAALGAMDGGMYGTGGEAYKGAARRNFDTGRYAPKSVVVDDGTGFGTKPKIAQKDAIIYEAHVRGLTRHSSSASLSSILRGIDGFEGVADIPADKQGTYAGAALMAPYLKALGVNTIELLPVHETDNDANPDDAPGGNFWGYMTYGYFAPDRRYASDKSYGGPTKEFKEMVAAFHAAGIEVYLDVVFNHSGEGGTWYGDKDDFQTSELTFMRGLDNSTYYALTANSKSYWETTGCGNNLQCDNPIVRKLILDSLTYWLDDMGVDGFRFDLAPVLGREKSGDEWVFSASAKTITDIAALGASRNAEMIAEAWDIGAYEVGNFPDGWAGWNGYYRDSIRAFVGNGNGTNKISYTDGIYGDMSHFGANEPSVNFVVAHDGFTLADLCSYSGTGNWFNNKRDWPFGKSDGGNIDENPISTNIYENGVIDEPASRRQRARNYFAMQMFSAGIPMIVYGDEFGRTQNGNNNPYNLDSVATWNNYNMISTNKPHTVSTGNAGPAETGAYVDMFGTFGSAENINGNFEFARFVMNERLANESLRQITGEKAIEWYSTTGTKGWADEGNKKAVMINGSRTVSGATYYLMINMTGGEVQFTFPAPATGYRWTRIVDTGSWAEANCNYWKDTDTSFTATASSTYGVGSYRLVILKQVADVVIPTVATPVISGQAYFSDATTVTIDCGTVGAEIRYTTNGTTPTEASALYSKPFELSATTTVKAKAFLAGHTASAEASKTFTKGAAPVISEKSGVMLQGFNWASASRTDASRHGTWYGIMQAQAADIGKTFAYVWFPPPSVSESSSPEGYLPTEWNKLDNAYGTEAQLKALVQSIKPARAIADVVVNHRNGYMSWGQFANPSLCGQGHDNCYSVKCFNFSAIASNDSGFSSPTSEMYNAAIKGANDTGESYAACRDLDHTNAVVQKEIIGWLNDVLKPAGFVGWRYDFVKGFGGRYVGQYNAGSSAEFSVGEYWPTAGFSASNPGAWGTEIKNWISATAGGGMRSRAFDFALKGILNSVFGCNTSNAANGSYALLANKASLMQSQPADAVTFIDNHDTGSTQAHWYLDPADVGAAYALILTHPGYPCVAWQHYFTDAESGGHGESQYIGGSAVPGTKKTYRAHIDSLIALRKAVGIEYDSALNVEAATSSVYAAKVAGTNGELAVAIGSGWTPDGDGYAGNNPVCSGTNFKIWQKGASGEEGGGTEAATVELSVSCDAGYGNAIYITGSFVEGSSWKTGVKCTWSTGNIWKAVVTVPEGGTFEWKALRGADGAATITSFTNYTWQSDPNNSYPGTTSTSWR